MDARRRRHLRLGIIAALVLAGGLLGILAHRSLGIDWSVGSLQALVTRLGFWGPAVFVLLIGLRTPLLLPSQLVLTASGLCFGTLQGTLVGALGLLVSATLAFGLGRSLGAEAVQRRVPARLARALEAAGSRGGVGLLALGTGYPFGPTTAYHAAASMTDMRFPVFLLAVGTGAAVRAWTFSYFGSSLAQAHWTAAAVSAALIAGALLPLLHCGARSWVLEQFALHPRGVSQGGASADR